VRRTLAPVGSHGRRSAAQALAERAPAAITRGPAQPIGSASTVKSGPGNDPGYAASRPVRRRCHVIGTKIRVSAEPSHRGCNPLRRNASTTSPAKAASSSRGLYAR
jgi:hypothetical protein